MSFIKCQRQENIQAISKKKPRICINVCNHEIVCPWVSKYIMFSRFMKVVIWHNALILFSDNQSCYSFKPDNRTQLGPLNDAPGTCTNIFPDISIPRSGRVVNITFYASSAGSAFVSFWKRIDEITFQLQAKIRVTANSPGLMVS